MLSTFTGKFSSRAHGELPECSGRVYPCERPWRPYERLSHRCYASHAASTVPGGFLNSEVGRDLPLRWGLAFASLGELVRTSSTNSVPRGATHCVCGSSARLRSRTVVFLRQGIPYTPHMPYTSDRANKADKSYIARSDERGLPLRWGLAFASLGELAPASSMDMVTARRAMQRNDVEVGACGELVRTSSTDKVPRGAHSGDGNINHSRSICCGELVRTSSIDHGPRGANGKVLRGDSPNSVNTVYEIKPSTKKAAKNEAAAIIVHTADDFCLSWSHYLAFRAGQIGNAHHQSSNIK